MTRFIFRVFFQSIIMSIMSAMSVYLLLLSMFTSASISARTKYSRLLFSSLLQAKILLRTSALNHTIGRSLKGSGTEGEKSRRSTFGGVTSSQTLLRPVNIQLKVSLEPSHVDRLCSRESLSPALHTLQMFVSTLGRILANLSLHGSIWWSI